MNLIVLSAAAATLSEANKEIASYILVGMVFATAVGIVLYHIHLHYLAKSALWLKIKLCYQQDKNIATDLIPNTPELPIQAVSRTDIDLREPLLDDSIL